MELITSLIISSIFLILLSTYLIQHYASPGTSILLRLMVIISFWLGFSGIALLPIDLSRTTTSTNIIENEVDNVNETYLPWKITYWLTFGLAWAVLPFVREFLLSGQFTFLERCKDAIKKVLKGHVILLVVLAIVIIALAVHLRSWTAIPVLMAVGNTYGLLLVSLLLGYGLVDLPREMWRCACPTNELRRLRIKASAADEALCEAVWELQDCEDVIDTTMKKIDGVTSDDPTDDLYYNYCVDVLVNRRKSTEVLDPELQSRRTRNRGSNDGTDDEDEDEVPSIKTLALLNARIKKAQARLVSSEQQWMSLMEKSDIFSSLVDNTIAHPSTNPPSSKIKLLSQYIRYYWLTTIRSIFFRIFSILYTLLSIIVLWSETTMALPYNLSPFALILQYVANDLLFELLALIPLLYMSICVYRSLFKVQVFGPYALRGYKQSPGVALVFNAQYLVRMQFPLGYNYLLM